MSSCNICKTSSMGLLKECKKCGRVFCSKCARNGLGGVPKTSAYNKCPYCGTLNQLKSIL